DVHQLVEFFLDYDQNGVRSEPDGLFNGVLCGGPDGTLDSLGRCNTQSRRMAISDSLVLIMSGSNPQVTANFGATLDLTGGAQTAPFYIRDVNGQPMPAGTTIEAEVTNGEIVGPSSYTVGCMTSDAEPDLTYAFFVEPD